MFVNAKDVSIKIEGKGLDNRIIAIVERIIKPRVPGMLEKAISQQINTMISKLTCNRVEEEVEINDKFYLLTLNTTEIPSFDS